MTEQPVTQQQVLVVDDEPGILAKVSLLLASSDLVGSLLLGLYNDAGLLDHVGFTSGLAAVDTPASVGDDIYAATTAAAVETLLKTKNLAATIASYRSTRWRGTRPISSASEAQSLLDAMVQQGASLTPAEEQTLIKYYTR